MLISHRFLESESRFQGRIEPDRVLQIVRPITSRPVPVTPERRARILNEPFYRVDAYIGLDKVQALHLWRHELAEDARLSNLTEELEAALQEIVGEKGAPEPRPDYSEAVSPEQSEAEATGVAPALRALTRRVGSLPAKCFALRASRYRGWKL
jgi:hypothetical protein